MESRVIEERVGDTEKDGEGRFFQSILERAEIPNSAIDLLRC